MEWEVNMIRAKLFKDKGNVTDILLIYREGNE